MSHPADDPIIQIRAAMTAALRGTASGTDAVARVCAAGVESSLPVDGASISMLGSTGHHETLYTSDKTIAAVEDLQFTLGEGPCYEVLRHRRSVFVTDLDTDPTPDWPVFATEITSYPVGAIFAFPWPSGTAIFGAMDLYRTTPGCLTPGELATALQLADFTAAALLLGFSHGELDDETVAAALPHRREVVHQAAGMLTAAYRIPAADALARLRGYAFATESTAEQIAADLTSHRIHPTDIAE